MRNVTRMGLLAATALLSFACSSEPNSSPEVEKVTAPEPTGELTMELLASDSTGQAYRLRNATFEITPYYWSYPYPGAGGNGSAGFPGDGGGGPTTVIVSSETDPDATSIRTRLLPGAYYVTLRDPGWSLERINERGAEPVEQSVLLTPATQYAYVYDRGVTPVNYAFGVDGTLIDFRYGDLDITISIERPGEGGGYGGSGGVATGGAPPSSGGVVSAGGGPSAGGAAGL